MAMYHFLDSLGYAGVLVSFLAIIILTVVVLKFIFQKTQDKLLNNLLGNLSESNIRIKKHDGVSLLKYAPLATNIGFSISLLVVLAAFEMPQFDKIELVDLGQLDAEMEEQIEIPITDHKPPPPPEVKLPELVEVPNEEEIEDDIKLDMDVEIDEDDIIEDILEEDIQEDTDEIFLIVEDQAAPKGGYPAFYKYISENMKYPKQAMRMGVEGKVFVEFVVDKTGSLTNFKVSRGIGGGCDEEAIRVLSTVPRWKPGKQRGKAVKVRMTLPIIFRLQ